MEFAKRNLKPLVFVFFSGLRFVAKIAKREITAQDGAPSHTAGDTLKYLNSNKVKTMGGLRWPSRSADLSPLDYGYWAIVDRNIHKNRPDMKTMMDLKSAIIEEARKMARNQQLIDKIIDGFFLRMKRVVELEGGFVEPTVQFEV